MAEGSVYRLLAEAEIAVRRATRQCKKLRLIAEQCLIDEMGGDVKALGPTIEDRERWFVNMFAVMEEHADSPSPMAQAERDMWNAEDELTRAKLAVREYEAQFRMMGNIQRLPPLEDMID